MERHETEGLIGVWFAGKKRLGRAVLNDHLLCMLHVA